MEDDSFINYDMPDTPIVLDSRIINLELAALIEPFSTVSEADSLFFV